jgi:hypothetical protein
LLLRATVAIDGSVTSTTGKHYSFVGTFISLGTDEYKLIIFVGSTNR